MPRGIDFFFAEIKADLLVEFEIDIVFIYSFLSLVECNLIVLGTQT